jgi:predicted phage terminase large subunit-like protein
MLDADKVTASQAAAELLRRTRAKASLTEYARAIEIPGAPVPGDPETEAYRPVESAVATHHRVIMAAIQETMLDPLGGRLMIFAPPGSAKSTYGSVIGPTWFMGLKPGSRIILGSYASDIAERQSRKARAIARSPLYSSIWDDRPTLPNDQRAVGEWALTNGSEMMAAGLLAGITGNRANGLVIDDPVKNREDADSEALQDKTEEEYYDTASTRLLPYAWQIIIQTRWNENDLAGRLLPENYKGESGYILCRDGQVWRVLNIPARCEHEDDPVGRKIGEYLWTEFYPESHWQARENNPRAQRTWSALYQQRPAPAAGIKFSPEMFRWYDPDVAPGTKSFGGRPPGLPTTLNKYGASDYATKDEGGDFTEHGVVGMCPQADLWFLDWWFDQKTTDVTIGAFINLLKVWGPIRWWNEGGPIDKAIRPAVDRAMREANKWVNIENLTSIKNKSIKLEAFQARAAARTVWLPINRPWAQRVLNQLLTFPAGRYDDAADVCGLIGRGIDQMAEAAVPAVEQRKILVPFSAAWIEASEESDAPRVRYF